MKIRSEKKNHTLLMQHCLAATVYLHQFRYMFFLTPKTLIPTYQSLLCCFVDRGTRL
jgi:hypothetical protein